MLGYKRGQDANHALCRCVQRDIERQTLSRELVHHGQDPQGCAVDERILHKIIGPNMAWIAGLQASGTRSRRPTPAHPLNLEPILPPQSLHAILVDMGSARSNALMRR